MRRFVTFEEKQVEWAAIAARAPFFGGTKNRRSDAQRAGIRYEYRAQEQMQALFPDTYVASPWLIFRLKREPYPRHCQPDGLLFELPASRITIVEIKLRHMAEAYTQINGIYLPVLRNIFPGFSFRQVEVTRYYDPAVHFPVPVQLVSHPALTPAGRFGVHIWNP